MWFCLMFGTQLTFVVEEAIISQNKPFSLPQPHPRAVLKVQSNTNTDGKTHTFRRLKTSDGDRQHFKQTSNRQFRSTSPVSLPVKEFIQSLLWKTIHVNTLLMFSRRERLALKDVRSCVFASETPTGWLSKRKTKRAANLDSFFMRLNTQNVCFDSLKMHTSPKNAVLRLGRHISSNPRIQMGF